MPLSHHIIYSHHNFYPYLTFLFFENFKVLCLKYPLLGVFLLFRFSRFLALSISILFIPVYSSFLHLSLIYDSVLTITLTSKMLNIKYSTLCSHAVRFWLPIIKWHLHTNNFNLFLKTKVNFSALCFFL